jgi:hypothetical protein
MTPPSLIIKVGLVTTHLFGPVSPERRLREQKECERRSIQLQTIWWPLSEGFATEQRLPAAEISRRFGQRSSFRHPEAA